VSDFDPIEKERGHSIDAAIASIDTDQRQRAVHVNLLDTPGYPDFRGPTLSTLAAVETVAIVVRRRRGVEYGTRRMMEYAKARNLCASIIVNKIDHAEADNARLLERCANRSAPKCSRSTCPPTAARAWSIASVIRASSREGDSISAPSPIGTRRSSTRSSK
jgi:elongation factor G